MTNINKDIKRQLTAIENSVTWAAKYRKETFPVEELKEYRRKLKTIGSALEENCSAAAYGESQVGKSYLMSSLLSSPNQPFVISNKGKEYSFIDELNPSGGNTSKTESTGVITRFTLNGGNPAMKDYVRVRTLSVADIVMMLADSYYNDLKIDPNSVMTPDDIDKAIGDLQSLWDGKKEPVQQAITEDDIKDILDYLLTLGSPAAANLCKSKFRAIIPEKIEYLNRPDWAKVVSLLWNRNEKITELFTRLIDKYSLLKFQTEIYVPFEAVLRQKGTLLMVEWLDFVCGKERDMEEGYDPFVDVYDTEGKVLAKGFEKAFLSALISEISFTLLPEIAKERKFLEKIDLLDFPGARSREKFSENDIEKVMPTILRRGKVAYLFRKYSQQRRISSVLFCHHNDQKAEASLGETIDSWIKNNIGKDDKDRVRMLKATGNVSPLFLVATKFNLELQKTKLDSPGTSLEDHWKRFKTVFPEIIKPATWFDKWLPKNEGFDSEAFQSVYLLRDFYWSGKNQVFEGYDEKTKSPETGICTHADYKGFFDDLKRSFLSNDFVKKHFANPEAAWNSVALPNNDGSKVIIRDLDALSDVLDNARREKYLEELCKYKEAMLSKLSPYYEPEDRVKNNERISKIVKKIRFSLDINIGAKPETFGHVIDNLMIPVADLRRLAYDIIILRKATPKEFSAVNSIRQMLGINVADGRDVNEKKLKDAYGDEIEELLEQQGLTLNEVLEGDQEIDTTVAAVLAKSVIETWNNFINRQATILNAYLPFADEVALTLQKLCRRLEIKKILLSQIDTCINTFAKDDQSNAIADSVSLTLNNFCSSMGIPYMNDADIEEAVKKAETCGIPVDRAMLRSQEETADNDDNIKNVEEALKVFDEVIDSSGKSPMDSLMKLPFWNNYQRWKNSLFVGMLFTADVSHCDPEANAAIKAIIDECETLYAE